MEQEIEAIFEAIAEFVKQQHVFPSDIYSLYFYYVLRSHTANHTYFKGVGDKLLEIVEGLKDQEEERRFLEAFLRRTQSNTKYNILYIVPWHLKDIFQHLRLRLHLHDRAYIESFCQRIGATDGLRRALHAIRMDLYRDLLEMNKELKGEIYEVAWQPERIVKMLDEGMTLDEVFDLFL